VRRDRWVVAELKAEGGKATDDQIRVLAVLARAGAETFVWRPSDWDSIVAVLR
jgi:chorismate mutase